MPTIKKRAYAAKKQPEPEIVTIWHSVSAFMETNKKIITIMLSVAAAAALIFGGLSVKRSMDEQSAGPLFAAAYDVYSRGAAPDHAKALDLFQNIRTKYPSTRSGALARYYEANCLMDLGRNDEALKGYQALSRDYTSDSLLLGLVYERMGYLYKAMGKQADAIKAFERADSLNGPGIATVELAQLYEAAGNVGESQKNYKRVADNLSGTSLAFEAMSKVQKSGGVPVAPAPLKEGAGTVRTK